jgi:hypothetical protein
MLNWTWFVTIHSLYTLLHESLTHTQSLYTCVRGKGIMKPAESTIGHVFGDDTM